MTDAPRDDRNVLREPLMTGAVRLGAVAAAMRAVKAEDSDGASRKPRQPVKKAA
jgi:hypothetical protein